jgi:hypothetical protein
MAMMSSRPVSAARQVVRPATTYHSTDLYHAGHVAKVDAMLEHVRDDAGWSVVAVQLPFSGHADAARQECLRVLLVELSSRKVRRMVSASRYQPGAGDPRKHDKADERTARLLRQDGLIDRFTTVSHATDAAEPLLWLPDGVAWSVRRSLSADDHAHYDIIRAVTTLLIVN